jgi:competence protein ComFC
VSSCLVCYEPVAKVGWRSFLTIEQSTLCGRCEKDLEKIDGPICDDCGRRVKEDALCVDCVRWNDDPFWSKNVMKNRSVYIYNEGMKTMLNQFKFRGDMELVKTFRDEVKQLFLKEFKSVDLVSVIPLSSERLYERGFNQAEAIAQLTGRDITPLLSKKHEPKQSKKSRKERLERENPFEVLSHIKIQNKHILLVDDLYTTGTTLRNAAKVLLEHGAAKISSLTLIRS